MGRFFSDYPAPLRKMVTGLDKTDGYYFPALGRSKEVVVVPITQRLMREFKDKR